MQPINAALADVADDSNLAITASQLNHVVIPEQNFAACKEAYLNENKVFRDIGKGVNLNHVSVEKSEELNRDSAAQGYLSDNKLLKDISLGSAELKSVVSIANENLTVTQAKIFNAIEKQGKSLLTKPAAGRRIATEIDLSTQLPRRM